MNNDKPYWDKSNEQQPGNSLSKLAAHRDLAGDVGKHWPRHARVVVEQLFAVIDALIAERDALEAASDMNFAAAKQREHQALRRGFAAAQAWNPEEERPQWPFFEDYERHLAELEDHAAREARIAEAEEKAD
jgi:hypothetical protein